MPETQVQPLGQEDPLELEMATHSSILTRNNSMDRGAWWATVHRVAKSQTCRSAHTVICWVHEWAHTNQSWQPVRQQRRAGGGYSPGACKESDTTVLTQKTNLHLWIPILLKNEDLYSHLVCLWNVLSWINIELPKSLCYSLRSYNILQTANPMYSKWLVILLSDFKLTSRHWSDLPVNMQIFLLLNYCCYSSTLAWKIPWTEEPGGRQSMGSLRVGHDWATSLSLSCIGEGNGNPLQCSCLENPRDGGAWWAAIYGVTQSRTWWKWLSSSSIA